MTTTEPPSAPAAAFTTSHGPEPMSPASAMADLGALMRTAKAVAASGTAKPSYPVESFLLLLLSGAGTLAAALWPSLGNSVREVFVSVAGLLTAVIASQRHATARKR